MQSTESLEDKNKVIEKIQEFQDKELDSIRKESSRLQLNKDELDNKIIDLQQRLRELEKRNLTYPEKNLINVVLNQKFTS